MKLKAHLLKFCFEDNLSQTSFFLLNFDQSIFNRALATFKTGLAENIDRSPDSFLMNRQKLCINLFEEDRFSI